MSAPAEPESSAKRGGRLKGLSLLALLAGNGVVLLAWSQQWYVLHLDDRAIPASGQVAAGPLLALALTGLVLVAALALAGVAFRIILGVLQIALGGCITLQAALTIGDPARASSSVLRETAGISGQHAADLVDRVDGSGWPALALVAGIVVALLGLLVAVTATRWPVSSRRYTRTRLVAPDGRDAAEAFDDTAPAVDAPGSGARAAADAPGSSVAPPSSRDAVADWDALSEGDDPTR
ncbi:hypothetical protein GCM10027515_21650 [Schumannella luteola]|uniref:Putative membrane protein (TIGR02234 family) n=1 Tax=Schumannella luteola TaxID=472059 RepID=A0A852YQP4_9MICO|nr:Trp biosynthesis-associated membrane protein [Schumannella luteola]NYH00040.1 putative membrane protein (TIGR02234 family) [Schumannella luteola]TPX06597.1 Trp biosynthesis-associated membrane protein [Schumannella luteola]